MGCSQLPLCPFRAMSAYLPPYQPRMLHLCSAAAMVHHSASRRSSTITRSCSWPPRILNHDHYSLRPLVPHRDFHFSSALWNTRTAGMHHGPVGERLHPPLHQDITRHISPSGKVSRLTAANERYLEPVTKLT